MKKERKDRYLQFPVSFIPQILTDTDKGLENAMSYGITLFLRKLEIDNSKLADRLIYANYNKGLPDYLTDLISPHELELFGFGTDYKGFIDGKFDPEDERAELCAILDTDKGLLSICRYWYACDFFGLVRPMLLSYEQMDENEGKPHSQIKVEKMLEFMKYITKQRDIEILCTHLAINSTLGTNGYNLRLDYKKILSRVMGFASLKDVPSSEDIEDSLKPFYDHYYPIENGTTNDNNRRRRQKLLNETCERWHYVRFSHAGFAIGKESKYTKGDLADMVAQLIVKDDEPTDAQILKEAIENRKRRIKQDKQLPF